MTISNERAEQVKISENDEIERVVDEIIRALAMTLARKYVALAQGEREKTSNS